MEVEAEPATAPRGPGTGVRPTRVVAAIEIRAPATEHEPLRDSVRAALALPPGAALDAIAQPGGRTGADPAVWSPVSCRSRGESFVVTFGPGAMDRWLGAGGDGASAWDRHAAAMGSGPGRAVVQAFVDLNTLRREFPDAFGNTPLRRTLRACGLANAREAMLSLRLVDAADVTYTDGAAGPPYTGAPLLAIDGSWSSRTEPPGTVRAIPLASARWPAGVPGLEPRPGRYALALRPDWIAWTRLVLGVYLGAGDDWDEATRTTRISRWERLHGEALGRIARSSAPWAIAWAPVGEGALLLAAPYAGDTRVQADHRIIFGSIHDAVAYDASARAWSVDFSSPPLALRWTTAGEGERRAILGELRAARRP